METYFAGIDLGGTNIAAGVVASNGKILGRGNLPAKCRQEPEQVCKDMKDALMRAVAESGIPYAKVESVGIGVPGAVQGEGRRIQVCNNIRLDGFPVKETMEKLLEKPIFLENDANAAAYGEKCFGAGRGRQNLLLLTLGTGVGAGVIIDGRIFSGSHGLGGEIGHMGIVKNGVSCTCGRKGCFEMYGSATGLIRIGMEMRRKYPDSLLWKEAKLDGKRIFEAEKAGDQAANCAVEKYISYLSYGIANVLYIFDPQCVILGGGISNQGESFARRVSWALEQEKGILDAVPEVVCARLGNDAGMIGAAFLENLDGG